MKCPLCGAWTSVRETRSEDFFIRRRRECANGHREWTYEVLESVYKSVAAHAAYRNAKVGGNLGKVKRNQDMLKMYERVKNFSEVGRKFGVSNVQARTIILAQQNRAGGSSVKKPRKKP